MENLETNAQPAIPQSLKTLCILTFVGCGILFLLSFMGIPKAFESIESRMDQVEKIKSFSPEMGEQLEAQLLDPNYKMKAITKVVVDLIFIGFTLTGAILMWRLKKKGFYIYTASEFLYYLSGFITGQGDPSKMMSSLPPFMKNIAMGVFALVVICDLLFIFLYWRQTKYMS